MIEVDHKSILSQVVFPFSQVVTFGILLCYYVVMKCKLSSDDDLHESKPVLIRIILSQSQRISPSRANGAPRWLRRVGRTCRWRRLTVDMISSSYSVFYSTRTLTATRKYLRRKNEVGKRTGRYLWDWQLYDISAEIVANHPNICDTLIRVRCCCPTRCTWYNIIQTLTKCASTLHYLVVLLACSRQRCVCISVYRPKCSSDIS